jgi:hypothetical protein
MTKAILLQGCSTCPYNVREYCLQLKQSIGIPDGKNTVVVPRIPHPECKLPDLPTSDSVHIYADNTIPTGMDYNKGRNAGFKDGADFIINKIK